MKTEDKSSIYLSIFKRKGEEGTNTKVITKTNRGQFANLLYKLDNGEIALLVYYQDALNWFLLTNNRVLMLNEGLSTTLNIFDIVEVHPALEEELKDRVFSKGNFTRLRIKTKDGESVIGKIEKGRPYEGIYQVLHFIMSSNVSSL
jgi:hypothetical protein